ncbi:alpha/beta hydrolase [Williamsia phyllosphaerae]|uniref:Alpha/beta hydrolase n=1 Tax=Williamsia phyllosphaerae TaxID=885042 RepID=A0ABQ1UQY9_9NOCA|nr:alpha/beta hydrolase [Williamsia phyllosphaerae]GGF23241.1 alpha/beta hydrolase [Williamsia phyllosphaerae]
MATFLLIPGGASDPSYWRVLCSELADRSHRAIPIDLPCEDDDADLTDYAAAVAAQTPADADRPIVVAHSFGGFTAPLACPMVDASMLVFASAMIPRPGERPEQWWAATGTAQAQREAAASETYDPDDMDALFYNGVDPEVVAEQIERTQSDTPARQVWPASALPDVDTRFLLFRDDRFFPELFMRRVVADRLGVEPGVIAGGHMAMLSHAGEFADHLDGLV